VGGRAVLVAAAAALVFAAPATAANLLPNPSFEGSLSGWKAWNGTLALASDGTQGAGAAKVVSTSTSFSIYTSPRPVSNEPAGIAYHGTGWVRSDTPGHTVCIFIREWSSTSAIGSAKQCLASTTAWQQLPTVTYTTVGGASLEEYVYATGTSGDSFEVDGMSLDGSSSPPPPDTTPPDTTITSGPADGSSSTATTASFAFTSTESGTFQCSLDSAAWTTCTSPQSYTALTVAQHTFQVRAIDAAGNVDATPASRTWTVTAADTTPPDTTITSGPAQGSSTTDTTASFAFASTEPDGTFQCALDLGPWSTCTSPQSYGGLTVAQHTFQVRATDAAGNVDPTPASRTWSVTAPAPPPSSDPTMLLVGDQHACDSAPGAFSAVAALIDSVDPSGVDPIASLGDESGENGTLSEFTSCFDPVWGHFKPRVHPAIGNHDWQSGNADGYFTYWGAAAGPVNKGWYSYDVGTWHVIVLSSYCGKVGGCGMGSPQVAWLKSDLAAHKTQCTLAYWHHPYYTSSPQPGTSGNTSAFWSVLYANGADVIVNAHVRMYERFAPQDASGNAVANGIREFIAGTGGGPLASYSTRAANSEVIDDTSFGVLALTLHPGSYDWKFASPGGSFGSFTDSGSASCH
jgi:hypothetical protein